MSRLLGLKASILVLLAFSGAASAADCFQLETDAATNQRPNWTLTEVGKDLEWSRDGEKVVLMTGSGGSGIPVRQALEPDGTSHRMVGDKLVFDMAVYERGCKQ